MKTLCVQPQLGWYLFLAIVIVKAILIMKKNIKNKHLVTTLIQLNIFVFLLWYLMLIFDPHFMSQHFLVSWKALVEGRWWTLITSVFSHNLLFHLFLNMYFLYNFGLLVESHIGTHSFLALFFFSGVLGSLSHCFFSHYFFGNSDLKALGASGAISGLLIFFALTFPWRPVYLFGLIPIPAAVAIFLFVILDVWGLISQINGKMAPIGFGAHLGGSLAGCSYYFFKKIELARLNRQNIS